MDCARQALLSFPISWSLLKLMSIELGMLSSHLILCCPPSSPAFNLSQHQHLFQCFGSFISGGQYWSFSFSISPSSDYSGLISFRLNWFDLLAAQGTLKSLLQHHNLKASVLSLLYGPALTSIHDYWKNHSFGWMDLCQQGDVSALIW